MRVQGEPSGKTLISDPPIGGSTDHVDQRGVWGKKYFLSIKAKAIFETCVLGFESKELSREWV